MNRGFTYKLQDKTNPELVYYGSSEMPTLEDRLKIHIYNFEKWKKNNDNGYCSSYRVLELGNYKPTLLKIVFFTIKWELWEQERKLIENNECVNIQVPNRTPAEYREANKEFYKEYHAEYREANREQLKQNEKEYYQANKEYFKDYYQQNKDKILEQNAEYRVKNKDKIKEKYNKKFVCDCSGKYTYQNKTRHIKSPKHQNWVKSQLSMNFDKWKTSVGIFTIHF